MADEIPLTGKNRDIDRLITMINKMEQSGLVDDAAKLKKQLDIKKAAFPKLFKGTEEYQKAKELKAKGGMIDKYKKGGSVSKKKKKKKKKPRGVGVAKRGW